MSNGCGIRRSLDEDARVKFDGKVFIDGGIYDNLPINMMANRGYINIIAIRNYTGNWIRKYKGEKDINLKLIQPKDSLGGILNFNHEQIMKNIDLGYFDTMKVFKDYCGYNYYFNIKKQENFFFQYLLNTSNKEIQKLCDLFGIDSVPSKRILLEIIIPKISGHM